MLGALYLINPFVIHFFNYRYFKIYREANCDVECRMIKTLELCGCIPYYYPNAKNLPVCNFTKIECLVERYCKYNAVLKLSPLNQTESLFDFTL